MYPTSEVHKLTGLYRLTAFNSFSVFIQVFNALTLLLHFSCQHISTPMAILNHTNGLASTVHDGSFSFDSIQDALNAFARGEFLVVMDDEGRENEGDLIGAASLCTTEKMAFMIKHTS